MIISVEISLYPLDKNYAHVIREFIDKLRTHKNIKIEIQPMSTLLLGEYDLIMHIITTEMKSIFDNRKISVSILKIVNTDLSDQ